MKSSVIDDESDDGDDGDDDDDESVQACSESEQQLLAANTSDYSSSSSGSSSSSSSSSSGSRSSSSSSEFRIENEFPGLHAVFPIDAAVYREDRLIAFLEVDGDTHFTYDMRGQKQLRRIDMLKMFLYRNRFPSIPIYRINVEDSNKYGMDAVCRDLAMSIYQSC